MNPELHFVCAGDHGDSGATEGRGTRVPGGSGMESGIHGGRAGSDGTEEGLRLWDKQGWKEGQIREVGVE